ncbi:MAG: hypothetical protein HUU16_20095 [Candidatus Omnitrophica bacterium]|nr:hypothetical protein [Candidatus Omnitrophota bacterium]
MQSEAESWVFALGGQSYRLLVLRGCLVKATLLQELTSQEAMHKWVFLVGWIPK